MNQQTLQSTSCLIKKFTKFTKPKSISIAIFTNSNYVRIVDSSPKAETSRSVFVKIQSQLVKDKQLSFANWAVKFKKLFTTRLKNVMGGNSSVILNSIKISTSSFQVRRACRSGKTGLPPLLDNSSTKRSPGLRLRTNSFLNRLETGFMLMYFSNDIQTGDIQVRVVSNDGSLN